MTLLEARLIELLEERAILLDVPLALTVILPLFESRIILPLVDVRLILPVVEVNVTALALERLISLLEAIAIVLSLALALIWTLPSTSVVMLSNTLTVALLPEWIETPPL